MKKVLYLILLSALFSCNSEGISTELIDNNEYLIRESIHFLEIRNSLDPYKAANSHEKTRKILLSYNTISELIELGQVDNVTIQNYLNEIEKLDVIKLDFYQNHVFNYKSTRVLKYQIQNLTLQALHTLKLEFYDTYYSSYKTKILTVKKGNSIEFHPFSIDTLNLPHILVGELKQNTNEFNESFIELGTKNKISLEELAKIGLVKNIEGICIYRNFIGKLDTLRFINLIE